ncbi:MAG: hypothetical protein CSB02_00100 [Bacteroidia bacterium]|nr:MAG: hypothetical protein CSB02_00100 [Bacteroidia bacterium]
MVIFLGVLSFLYFSTSCKKDEQITTDPSYRLSFSTDSVTFDTIFSTMGSVSKGLMVYNRNPKAVKISRIALAGGKQSPYRINIDGQSTTQVHDIELMGNDSMYIFVKVQIDPQNDNLPFVVHDSIVFETNGNRQDVDLVSWGQDAHFIIADQHISGLPPFAYIAREGEAIHWPNDKPYVIVGYGVVDSAASLHIDAGCRIHFYNNSGLWIYKSASLQVQGTADNKVVFQGVRTKGMYENLPAQWDRIWINESDDNTVIEHAVIKNGLIGLQLETLHQGMSNQLRINNTEIRNMSGWGIFSRYYNIEGNNLLVANAGSALLNLTGGGEYQFKNSTFANFWRYTNREDPSLHLSDYFSRYDAEGNQTVYLHDMNAYFGDCILYGGAQEEILIDKYPDDASTSVEYLFDYCLLKTQQTTDENMQHSLFNENPLFVDYFAGDYHIDSLSPARQKGIPMGNPLDLDGIERGDTPDLGAYQWQAVDDRVRF